MTQSALILLHAPSTYDFRQMTILRGPISDLVPSSSVFEMYPIGFTSIANHLENYGYPVRVINIASRMLQDSEFDVESFIKKLPEPYVYGIDLHWLPHAHGAIEIARLVKKYHPTVPILLGGFSASYFHKSLMMYPEIDFVLRGDATEDALRQLLRALELGEDFARVPNLTWRNCKGEIQINPLIYQPDTLDSISYDFRRMMVSSIRDRDILSYLPFQGWLKYPIMPAISCHGCVMNCVGCGGSAFAFKHLHERKKPIYRSAEKLAEDVFHIASVSNAPIFILGDIRQAGNEYATRFLSAARGVSAPIALELFRPATRSFIKDLAEALPNFSLEMSIESHDPIVRYAYGKHFSNEEFEATVRYLMDYGVQRVDVFFMSGLPKQDYASVMATAVYAEQLLQRFGTDQRLRPFIGPMAPFVDPGSRAFEHPDQHGYRLFYRNFEEHRQALLEPSWQFTLNYETQWMNRHQIVHSTYDSCLRFAEIKAEFGLITTLEADRVIGVLQRGKQLALKIEELHAKGAYAEIDLLRTEVDEVNRVQGTEENEELKFLYKYGTFKWHRVIWLLMKARWHAFRRYQLGKQSI